MLINQFYQPRAAFDAVGASAAYTNFLARSTALDTTHQTAYQILLDGLTTDSFFDGSGNSLILDALYIFATQSNSTRANAKLNLVQNAYNLTENGTVSFAADVGYTGDGSTFYLDTGFTPSSASSPKFVQDSASYGLAVQTAGSDSGHYHFGGSAGAGSSYVYLDNAGTMGVTINGSAFTTANSSAKGLWGISRTTASGAGAGTVYQNGSTTAFVTDTSASTGVSSVSLLISAINVPTPAGNSAVQISAAWIGSGLSAANYKKLSDRINAYLTTFSVGLY